MDDFNLETLVSIVTFEWHDQQWETILLAAGLLLSVAGCKVFRPAVFALAMWPGFTLGRDFAQANLPGIGLDWCCEPGTPASDPRLQLIGTVTGVAAGYIALRRSDIGVLIMGAALGAGVGFMITLTPYDAVIDEMLPEQARGNPAVYYGVFAALFGLLTMAFRWMDALVVTLFTAAAGSLMAVSALDMLGVSDGLPLTSPLFLVETMHMAIPASLPDFARLELFFQQAFGSGGSLETQLNTKRGQAALLTWATATAAAVGIQFMLSPQVGSTKRSSTKQVSFTESDSTKNIPTKGAGILRPHTPVPPTRLGYFLSFVAGALAMWVIFASLPRAPPPATLDTSGDTKLQLCELMASLREGGNTASSLLRHAFAFEIDVNRDGKIAYTDLQAWLVQLGDYNGDGILGGFEAPALLGCMLVALALAFTPRVNTEEVGRRIIAREERPAKREKGYNPILGIGKKQEDEMRKRIARKTGNNTNPNLRWGI